MALVTQSLFRNRQKQRYQEAKIILILTWLSNRVTQSYLTQCRPCPSNLVKHAHMFKAATNIVPRAQNLVDVE
eukprot:scaffold191532_cov22-Prasinocladus_malaysianus.AAC.1